MAQLKKELTATGIVSQQPGYYWGYVVTVSPSAAVTVYDNASAAAGTVVGVVPSAAAVGTVYALPSPVPVTSGLYASFAGTGTVLFLYD